MHTSIPASPLRRRADTVRILAIHRYFWPDTPPYASFLRLITGRWASEGNYVEILTSQPSYISAGGLVRRPATERIDQLRVSRVPLVTEGGSFPGQMLNLFIFPFQVAIRIVTGPKRDLIMCSTAPQVTLGYAVSAAARLRNTSFVYHCMDLHPEIGRLSGEFAHPVAYRVLFAMDLATMRRADRIVVLSDDMRNSVVKRDPALESRIVVLNNFALPDYSTERYESPVPPPVNGTLRIIFTGNLGRFQGLDTAVLALQLLPAGTPVELIFMGEGKAKEELKSAAVRLASRHDVSVMFLPQAAPAAAKELMRSAHLGLVSLVPDVVRYAYPSKAATYMAEGLPLLVACEQESGLAKTVRERGLGLTVPPGDATAMASAIDAARRQLVEDDLRGWRQAVTTYSSRELDEQSLLGRWSALRRDIEKRKDPSGMSDIAIIVGAPRSGTNMLRDVLTSLDGFATWPCDEINMMWKHGNLDVPHDELTPAHARPEVVSFLREQFHKLGSRCGAHTVVEKTCATSLRVGFAREVFPDAKFILIRRDGVDAAPSAMKRWNAPFDLRYTLRKLRWVPLSDLPRHLFAFAFKKARQRVAGDSGRGDADLKVSTWWGPRPADFTDIQQEHPLDEVSIIQWQRCVESSLRDLADLPPAQVLEVVYEEFVRDPVAGLQVILEFLGHPESIQPDAVSTVSVGSVGKGREELGSEAAGRLDAIARTTLEKLGYA